jgi:hypothetical protein
MPGTRRMAALASYAKQAEDTALHDFAVRISARAIRRAGELLKTFDGQGARTDQLPVGARGKLTQRQAAEEAGLSEHQQLQAVRVANVPDDEFEAAIERAAPLARLGELLGPMEKAKGTRGQLKSAGPGRGKTGGTSVEPPVSGPTLKELGVDKKTSHVAQQLSCDHAARRCTWRACSARS